VVAIADSANDVFVWGTRTMQMWSPDENMIYAAGPTMEVGCQAPYSIIRVGSGFAWLDDRRRIVMGDGRSEVVLSDPIQADLQDMGDVSNTFGWRYTSGPWDAFIWTFPEEERTLCFQKGAGWSTWETTGRGHFPVTARTELLATGETVVGLDDGSLAYLDRTVNTDLGEPIVAYVETGFDGHDTDRQKVCVAVRLAIRRGHAASVEPVGMLSWRDDEGQWGAPIQVGFGSPNETESVVTLRGLGTYRRRQWRFTFSGTEDLVLAAASEDFRVVGED